MFCENTKVYAQNFVQGKAENLLALEGLEILGFIFHLQETIIEGNMIWKHTDQKAPTFIYKAVRERDRKREREVDFPFSQNFPSFSPSQ